MDLLIIVNLINTRLKKKKKKNMDERLQADQQNVISKRYIHFTMTV